MTTCIVFADVKVIAAHGADSYSADGRACRDDDGCGVNRKLLSESTKGEAHRRSKHSYQRNQKKIPKQFAPSSPIVWSSFRTPTTPLPLLISRSANPPDTAELTKIKLSLHCDKASDKAHTYLKEVGEHRVSP